MRFRLGWNCFECLKSCSDSGLAWRAIRWICKGRAQRRREWREVLPKARKKKKKKKKIKKIKKKRGRRRERRRIKKRIKRRGRRRERVEGRKLRAVDPQTGQ